MVMVAYKKLGIIQILLIIKLYAEKERKSMATDRKIRKNKEVKEVKEIRLDLILELSAESNDIDIIEMAEAIRIVFKKLLTPREEKILKMRFGLVLESYGEEYTYKQIARYEGVSGERIRQIEQRALKKLRHPTRKSLLKKMLFGDR